MKMLRYAVVGVLLWAALGPRAWAAPVAIELGDVFSVGTYLRSGSPIGVIYARRIGSQGGGTLQFRLSNEVARSCVNAAYTARSTGDVVRFFIPSLPFSSPTIYTATSCSVY